MHGAKNVKTGDLSQSL